MVAKLKFPKSLKRVLNYNENKVKAGVANCILAENFLLDVDQLNFKDKLARFQEQLNLNERIQTKLVHGFISFENTEKLSGDELKEVAKTYMSKIGFAEQPYLVYQHSDSGTPHLHIVTITIKEDGSPIYVNNIGRDKSNKARIEIEKEFNLIKAEGRDSSISHNADHSILPKVLYGEGATKRQIVNLLDAILLHYRYSSLEELNAILRLGNVVADRGHADGRIFKNNGLVYRALNEQGKKEGVGIKASSIYNKPTLPFLEEKFLENKLKKQQIRTPVKNKVLTVLNQSTDFAAFVRKLKDINIDVAVRRNDSGFIYGLTFVDHDTKCVFNGSHLGKEFSAAAVQKRLNTPITEPQEPVAETASQKKPTKEKAYQKESTATPRPGKFHFQILQPKRKTSDELIQQYQLLKQLLQNENAFNQIPFELTRKRKKKKKKRNQNL